MKSLALFVSLMCAVTTVRAEVIGTFTIEAGKTEIFAYQSEVGHVFAFKVLHGPELPAGQRGFEFGWKKQSVYCEGKDCTRAGGYLLFCPNAGIITGTMKNISQSKFEISVERVECEGKDAGSMQCPRAATIKAMCG